jgi:hypothetical protein
MPTIADAIQRAESDEWLRRGRWSNTHSGWR